MASIITSALPEHVEFNVEVHPVCTSSPVISPLRYALGPGGRRFRRPEDGRPRSIPKLADSGRVGKVARRQPSPGWLGSAFSFPSYPCTSITGRHLPPRPVEDDSMVGISSINLYSRLGLETHGDHDFAQFCRASQVPRGGDALG